MTIIDRREAVAEGLAVKAPCRVATTANITLSGLQTIDGVTVAENDRVLVKSQTDATQNGIYTASTGNWQRTRDFDGAYDVVTGTRVLVTSGTVNADFEYAVSTTGDILPGTTAISFTATGEQSAAQSAAAAAASAAAAAADAATVAGQVWTTGDVKLTLKTTADATWVMCNDGTIGDASSVASTRANADCQALFMLLWNNISDTYAPVTGGRGASAAADWAAHKKISLTKMLGRALAIAGAGSGLTPRALGFTVGEETHALTAAENGPHQHDAFINDPGHTHSARQATGTGVGTSGGSNQGAESANTVQTGSSTTGVRVKSSSGGSADDKTASSGSGTAHNNMQPSAFLNAMIKL